MPAKTLLEDFQNNVEEEKIGLWNLVSLARQYQVSTDALTWRLHNLGYFGGREKVRELLANPRLRELDKMSRQGEWDRPAELPKRFVSLAYMAVSQGRLSRSVLAGYLGCSLPDLSATLATYGIVDDPQAATSREEAFAVDGPQESEESEDAEASLHIA